VVVLYAQILGGYFLADDFAYVAFSSSYPLARWGNMFLQDDSKALWGYSLGLLRPIYGLNGIIQSRLFHANAIGYHVVSLGLHIINVALVFRLAQRLFGETRFVAFAAALFFAVHPVHAETVSWIGGQSDLLPTAFLLGALLAFISFRRNGRLGSLATLTVLTALAVFTKENTVVLPLLMAGYDLLQGRAARARARREWLIAAAPYFSALVILALYFMSRRIALRTALPSASASELVTTILRAMPQRYADYTAGLLWPLDLSSATAWWAPGNVHLLLPCLLLFAAVPLLVGRRGSAPPAAGQNRYFFTGAIWFAVTTLPFLLSYSSPRHLYVVSAGFCIFLAATLLRLLASRLKRLQTACVIMVATLWAGGVVHECRSWRRAGAITRDFHRELAKLAHKPAGTAVIINVPPYYGSIGTLVWSVPFVLEPPSFIPSLEDHLIVLTNPPCYYAPHLWPKNPAIARLREIDRADTYIITFDQAAGWFRTDQLPVERVRHAADILQRALVGKTGSAFDAEWFKFVAALQ